MYELMVRFREKLAEITDPNERAEWRSLIEELEIACSRTIHTKGGDYAEGNMDKRSAGYFIDDVYGTLHQHFYQNSNGTKPSLSFDPAEISQLRQDALLAAYRKNWIEAARLFASLVERDPDDKQAHKKLENARHNLRLHDRYMVAQKLQKDGEWQAVLGALDEIAAEEPQFSDPDGLRVWAETERQNNMLQSRFGPVYRFVAKSHYDDAVQFLNQHLKAHPSDKEALYAVVNLLEDANLNIPAKLRVTCGDLLAQYGDPRLGVCSLPPVLAMIKGGDFSLGITEDEYQQILQSEKDSNRLDSIKGWYIPSINSQPTSIFNFALGRYPVTNAQYQLFIEADGYNPTAPWWQMGSAWLRESGKTQPSYWEDERLGIAYPNRPVVGITWYEAQAFAAWLSQSKQYNPKGYTYRLPSEAEWELAARGFERRIYPWGEKTVQEELANHAYSIGCTTAVGCYPEGATPEGIFDLAGNVWEWTRSSYAPYPYNPNDGRESFHDVHQRYFVIRGGSWGNYPINLFAARRSGSMPIENSRDIGVRIAWYSKI